jgi:hypothetical protein
MNDPIEFELGELIELRKPHPCGGHTWQVIRLGADIGIECQTCQHRVLVPRRQLSHQMKTPKKPAPEIKG